MRVDKRIRFEYAVRVDGWIFEAGRKKLRIKKYPATGGRDLRIDILIINKYR